MERRWKEMRWTEELGTHPAIGECTSERFVAKEGTCAASTGEEGVGFCLRRREKKGRGVEKGLEVVGGRGQRAFKGRALLRAFLGPTSKPKRLGTASVCSILQSWKGRARAACWRMEKGVEPGRVRDEEMERNGRRPAARAAQGHQLGLRVNLCEYDLLLAEAEHQRPDLVAKKSCLDRAPCCPRRLRP